MPTTEEINAFYNNLPEDQRRQAIESGDLERAISTGDLAPLQQYAPAPPPEAPAPPSTNEVPPEAIIGPRPGDSYGSRPEGGVAPTEDASFFRYLSAKYRYSFNAPQEGRPVTHSQARSYLKNLQPGHQGYVSTIRGMEIARAQELEYAVWVAQGKPALYPDVYQGQPVTPPPGAYTVSQWEVGTGLSSRAFTPGTEENRALNEGRLKIELSPDFLQRAGVRPEEVPERLSKAELSRALAKGDSSGVDTGPGIRGETSEEAGARFGRDMGAIGPSGPMRAPAPPPSPEEYIFRDIPEGYIPSDYTPGQASMAALGQLTPEQRVAAIQSGAARQAYEKGDIGALNPYAQPHEFDPPPLRGTPAEGFQGTDILMAGGGLAILRGFGEAPTPAKERAPPAGGPAQPPAMGIDVGSFYYPFPGLGVLGREVQGAGERFSAYLGRAGKTWIEEVGGIRPEPMPLPSEISADAKRYMEGGITETKITTVPAYPMQADVEGKLGSQTTTITTFRPFVDAEVAVRGEAGKGGKETFTEMLAGPPDPFRYITNIGPVKLPFKIGPIGRNEEVPLASEAYRLRTAPGVFTREVGSAVGLGIVKPVGQGISALENPLQAGMAAPAVALAFGVGLAMLPGQIAMTTVLNPAAGAGQVYGLVAPFSLAGKLRGARLEAKPTADIQFPGYSEGGVLLEVPKRGPIAGHIDLGGVVASRIMGRPVRSTVQVGEGGVFEIPLEWIDRPVVGGKAVSAEGLLRGLEIERRFSVDLAQGRTAEMQVPGNIEMRGSLRAQSKSISGFSGWLNKKGAEGLEDFKPRNVRVTQDISYAKGELGNVDFSRPTEINIASEQYPSLRGWDARLDNPQFAKAYWEAEQAEMIKTIGHEFRHSIQPNYYEWKQKNFAKTKGLLEYDAERFAEQAKAAWEAEVGPAAPERVYINRNLEPEVGVIAIPKEELIATVPRSAETVDVFRLGRAGEAEIEMFGEYFVPATREGTAYVKGAPKGLFKPMYETVKTAEPWMKGTKDITTVDVTPAPKNLLYHGSPDWQPGSQLPIYLAFSREWAAGFAKMGPKGGEGSIIKEFQIKPGAVGIDISELKSKAGIDISKYGPKKYGAYDAKGNEVNLLDSLNTKPGYLEFMSDVRNKGIDILFDKKDTRQLVVTNPNILIEYLDKPQVSTKYPIVRPQSLLEKITRRPAEEIKLVPQKRLLGYEATMSRETSGRLGEFMLGKTSPKGTVIRPSQIEIKSFEPLEGLTPKEIGAEATYGARGAPANLGLTEGAKGEPVFLGGIGAREKAVYTLKPDQFGLAPKALERFGLKSSLAGGRLEVEFGGVKGQPSLYDTPIGMKARGGRIEIRPGLAEQVRGRAGGLMERIKARRQAPISVDFQRKVKIPGPGDRRGSIFDYVAADRQEMARGAAASRAGAKSTGGAKVVSGGLISGGPGGRTAMGVVIERRGNMKLLELVDTESVGSGFRFYSTPGSKLRIRMPGASLRGGALGLATGALGLRGKVGASETLLQGQKDATRLLDAVMERSRTTQDLRMPGVLERERERVGVDVLRLEREKVTQGVGQIPLIGERQQVRVTEKVGQIERQVTVQDIVERTTGGTDTGGRGGGSPPPPNKGGGGYWAHLPGYLPGGRGGYWNFRYSLKRNPIATISDIARGGIRPPTSLLGRIKGLGLTRGAGLTKPPKRGGGKRKSTGRKKSRRRKR